MDWNEFVSYVTIAGMPLAVISFLVYVFNPSSIALYLFIIGVAMMVIGYSIASFQTHRLSRLLKNKMEETDETGFIMSLDGAYTPNPDEATIEYLE